MKYTVSNEQPPPYLEGVQYWERSIDPSNPGLMAAALKVEGIRTPEYKGPPPSRGWLAIEWTENPVGFYADGAEFEADEKPEYHFTEVGPSGHRIAERALNCLKHARWYQSHGYILVRTGYTSRTVIEKTALIDCHAIIMNQEDMEKFSAEFATVQYKRHEEKPTGNSINAKPLFIVPSKNDSIWGADAAKKLRELQDDEFIVVMRRHGLKPKGTVSEFD